MYNTAQVVTMETTINLSNGIIIETESLYNVNTNSKSIENASKDAIRFKKLQLFTQLKPKIHFGKETIINLRKK